MRSFINRLTIDATIFGNQCYSFLVLAIFSMIFFSTSLQAAPLSVSVTGSDGSPVASYRWLIEEDQTYSVVPGQTCTSGNYAECQALNFHKSYMPVIAEGHSSTMPDLDPSKKYYISVLPDSGYTIGGNNIPIGATDVSVKVSPSDVPTAQIRVLVFNDNSPTNGAPDTPQETGIAGMKLILEDAGGRYGISAQQIVNDVYGNPLGTTYSSQGVVDVMGDGTVTTDANGFATFENLAPAKYGVQAVPTTGSTLVQTSTIEGSKVVDAWVKANEPPFFIEFGPPGPHVFIGFTQQFSDSLVLTGGATITGKVTSLHNSRPPEFTFHSGAPIGDCWVGLNQITGGIAGASAFAAPCDENSNFTIPNVPEGSYQLVIWDESLLSIIAFQAITVTAGATEVALGDLPVNSWFARLEQKVFNDLNENGIWDVGEVPMPEQGTAIRWRDGTMYQAFPTDLGGEAPYDAVFPFFHWLVAEVAFDRFKATGVTVRVDGGGPLTLGEVLNPQPQSESEPPGGPFRVETGPVLTQAFQAFAGQTNVIEWGKTPYALGENGGISGIVYYATTRAEDDPRYAGAEVWEPGIPRIQVALYQDNAGAVGGGPDGIIDDANNSGTIELADVDNAPFGNFPGPEDFDNHNIGTFDAGDAIQISTTDSWDDNLPTGCQGDVFLADGVHPTDCFDGLRNFNQVRPGVFDGGYAFSSYFPNGVDSGSTEVDGLPAGTYIVATGIHSTYKTLKEEDRNVDFGDNFIIPNLLPPSCVGDDHLVPNIYSLFDSGEAPFYAGQTRPLCDRKQILLSGGKNAAVDFFMLTHVPTSGHIAGNALNDLANQFDPNAPAFGEKYAPPYLPISIRDWQGNEVSRTYSDRWGKYNALVPSTYTNSLPSSSGMSPNMLTACMNDPGPIDDGSGTNTLITDPNFKREYSQFCYTLQYLPGVTTYLDTPVLPISAFTGPGQFPLDCAYSDGTPVIWSTSGPTVTGPYVATAGETLTIVSAGETEVKNPDFNGTAGTAETITRDFGFGSIAGTVSIDGTTVPTTFWDNETIELAIPVGGQLEIHRANGVSTEAGIHVTIGGPVLAIVPGGSIQDAIDLAAADTTVIIPSGTYNEIVIMHKPIRLQGVGASTVINAASSAGTLVQGWRTDVGTLFNAGDIDLLPDQDTVFGPETLLTEQGAGIIVLAKNSGPNIFTGKETRIDGISISGSNLGGGIVVNGYAHGLEISNNRLFNNFGIYGGGIRVGHSIYMDDSINSNLNIHHNYVAENGSTFGAGGGVSLYWGSDNYNAANNYVCGNFTTGDGGGIGHLGKSLGGQINSNTIIFNQSFNQGTPVAGGGIFVGGVLGLAGALTEGSGSVTIDGNQIQGNNAGAGNGAGISLALINGADAQDADPNTWYSVDITNNKIVNNVAGLAGGGISLQDAARVNISNNTIAHNDSTATAGEAFCDTASGLVCDPNQSTPRASGIVSYQHSGSLLAAISNSTAADPYNNFSNPAMVSNIIWENRSFYFLINQATVPSTFGLVPDVEAGAFAVFDDLAVYPSTAGVLNPVSSTLTSTAGYDASNTSADPNFIFAYFNGSDGTTIQQVELTTGISVQPAFDEGGNYIEVRYGPLSPVGDYNIQPVIVTPPAVTLVSPMGDIGANTTPTFEWNSLGGDTDYKLWMKDPNGVITQPWYTSAAASCANGEPTCTILTTTPLLVGNYKWKVRARNAAGLGPWTSIQNFSIGLPLPPAVTLVAPMGNIGANTTPTFEWNSLGGDMDYKLWMKDQNGVITQPWYTSAAANCANGEATCTIITTTPLLVGNYKWKIRARNAAGLGPWTSIQNFSIGASLPPTVTLVAPMGDIGANTTPTFEWNSLGGDTDYKLWMKDPNGVITQPWYTSSGANCANGEPTCMILTTVPLISGDYKWRIRARNAAGMGPWTSYQNFSIGAPPVAVTLVAPMGDIGANTTPTFEWNSLGGDTDYKLWMKDPNGVITQPWYTSSGASCANGELTCTILTTVPLDAGNYKWRIRARNAAGLGPWTTYQNFSIVVAP